MRLIILSYCLGFEVWGEKVEAYIGFFFFPPPIGLRVGHSVMDLDSETIVSFAKSVAKFKMT